MILPPLSLRFVRLVAATAAVVVLIDQVVKAVVVRTIDLGTSVTVIDGVLRFTHFRNPGIAGGRLADAPTALIVAISALALVGLLAMVRSLGERKLLWLPAGMLLGGGIGNLIDRLRTGAVTDFIVYGNSGPANLADLSITFGIVGLVIVAWRSRPEPEPEPEPAGQGAQDSAGPPRPPES